MAIISTAYAGEIKDLKILKPGEYNTLTADERVVIVNKATERPFTGKYYLNIEEGVYLCRQCNAPLYRSSDKFDSGCGWPSFDDEIEGAVRRVPDSDGRRIEIICNNCGAHLGHVFEGEHMTQKNIRHCVNSVSLNFVPKAVMNEKKAYFAGGCFWGVEYYLEKLNGVSSVVSGYMGGSRKNPGYEQVCHDNTGEIEVVEVTYNPNAVSYEEIARMFFEIHDPTQADGQGPDIGLQYISVIFYTSDEEKRVVQKLIGLLRDKGYDVATKLRPAETFYKAEEYHQEYYKKHREQPYCHGYTKRF
jgi:peptide methionine sulfoxide reductase msrA/msrB